MILEKRNNKNVPYFLLDKSWAASFALWIADRESCFWRANFSLSDKRTTITCSDKKWPWQNITKKSHLSEKYFHVQKMVDTCFHNSLISIDLNYTAFWLNYHIFLKNFLNIFKKSQEKRKTSNKQAKHKVLFWAHDTLIWGSISHLVNAKFA